MESGEAILDNIAKSINEVFGRTAFAYVEKGELIIKFNNKTAWIRADGTLSGSASIAPFSPKLKE